ncbi:hypothetical protein B0T26DRAFT_46941 [Lasiosphaeria miniovina]|uniref:2EXR domain-containing protein n=1 Tax=Lasiosphaeria miniovina TaxID=1954250 RepID=A0AA40EA33_9PEZI|nr:uncharacterized protein B0T26DRAFT_46941 [Lasiosphaeria miniovina]KAK0733984.1 hypothetical protein B0T26DRAFT_46941 [Lasiosphaeria miniovina]
MLDSSRPGPRPDPDSLPTITTDSDERALGTLQHDHARPSLARLPFEIQSMIFEVASGHQVFFVEADDDGLIFMDPNQKVLAHVCRLSREIYTKGKSMCFDTARIPFWVNPREDIFYLHVDRTPPTPQQQHFPYITRRRDAQMGLQQLSLSRDKRSMIQNVAVDLQYMGEYPRRNAAIRLWSLFPSIKMLHLFVPRGPIQSPAPVWTADNLVLQPISSSQIVAPPGQQREMFYTVMYHIKKTFSLIMLADNGANGLTTAPQVCGHVAYIREP